MKLLYVQFEVGEILYALLRIQTAFDAKRIGVEKWWIILIVALIAAVIGTMLFLRPYQRNKAIVMLIGLNLIIDGILNLFVVQSTVSTIRRRNEWEA